MARASLGAALPPITPVVQVPDAGGRQPGSRAAWLAWLAGSGPLLERRITLIRGLGVLLCAALVPLLDLGGRLPAVYACLVAAAGYNALFGRLVAGGRPAWLLRAYYCGLFDAAASTAIIAATGGVDSPFTPAYFLVVVHTAVRFGRIAGLAASVATAACYAGLLFAAPGSPHAAAIVLLRVGFIVLVAVFAGFLSDRARAAEAALAAQLERARALHTAGAALGGSLEWAAVVGAVMAHARRLVGADGALLRWRVSGEDRGWTEPAADVSPARADLADLLTRLGDLAAWPALASGEVAVQALPDDAAGGAGPASLLRATIAVEQRPLGDLLLFRAGRPFGAADAESLGAFVHQATLALESARLYQRVHELAMTDPVTGLANHRALKEHLDDELARAARHGRPLCLLMLDLDHFKSYNDSFGHAAGDAALRAVAGALRRQTRRGDIVARYGGEEFVAVLPDTGAEAGAEVAERLRRAVAACAEAAALPRPVSVSAGLAAYPADGGEREALLHAADLALYRAKRAGRDRICAVSPIPPTL